MNLPRSRMMGAAASLAVVLAAAGVTLGVTTLLGVTFGGGGSGAAETAPPATSDAPDAPRDGGDDGAGSAPNGGPTPIPTVEFRSRKSICVQGVDLAPSAEAAVESEARSKVVEAMELVAENPYWEVDHLDSQPLIVDIGCPSLPPEPLYDLPLPPIEAAADFAPNVSERSDYYLSVFIMSSEELEVWVGDSEKRRAPQEYMVEGDVGYEVSVAVYLSEEELDDLAFVARVIEEGLGLPRQ
jgi:hypothetical protein